MRRHVYRLGVCRRSRHLGLAVLRDTTLVALTTQRIKPGQRAAAMVRRVADLYLVDEVVHECERTCRLGTTTTRPVTRVPLSRARAILLAGEAGRGHRALCQELKRRYPALRHRKRPTRDRIVQLLAVALALARAQEQQPLLT